MLGLQKPVKGASSGPIHAALGEELAQVFADAMVETANAACSGDRVAIDTSRSLWRTLTSEFIFFVLFSYVGFRDFVANMAKLLKK